MKLLLVVGNARDTFIYNYVIWLKKTINVSVDVFEVYESNNEHYDLNNYNEVATARGIQLPLPKGKGILDALGRGDCLNKFLSKRRYDIIHVHWVTAPVVLQHNIKKHCKSFVLTFWGGEFNKQSVLGSTWLYRALLNRLSRQVDCIIGLPSEQEKILGMLPNFSGIYKYASLGSAPLECLYELMESESKSESKLKLGIPIDRTTVLIGYSGKSIHQHIPIIEAFKQRKQYAGTLHLLAPMTRGANKEYADCVRQCLEESGFTYSMIVDQYLSDEDIARLRNATDITLQLSEWDAFSRSVIECLCARSVLIYGQWLNYNDHMRASNFQGIEVSSIKEGVETVFDVADNINSYQIITSTNSHNGKRRFIWSECIKEWEGAYKELLK